MLLAGASVAFSLGFACATPFAAFCAAAACTLPRRDAYYLTGAVWLANQTIGFAFIHYPWTVNAFAWGAAIGLTALLSTWAARQTVLRLPEMHPLAGIGLAFLAAFAAYETALLCCSLWLGGTEDFTLAIQTRIFAINAVALIGLYALNGAGIVFGIASSLPATRHNRT
jgi:hypothetical protein